MFNKMSLFIEKLFAPNSWVIVFSETIVTLLFTFIFSYTTSLILKKLYKKLLKNEAIWYDAIVLALKKPLQIVIWTIGITQCIIFIHEVHAIEFVKFVRPIRIIAIIFAIAWFIFALINELERYWFSASKSQGAKIDKTTAGAIAKVLKIVTVIVSFLTGLEILGVSIASVWALAGGGGVAIGFASKDLIANFFGALMIYLDKPFKVGDWIRLAEKDIEGYVYKIGLRCTIIKTLDKRPLYVPNSMFVSIAIENPSRMSHRRIYEAIGLRHEDVNVIGVVTDDVYTMLKKHPEIDKTQPLSVNVNAINSVSIEFMVYAFTKKTELEDFYRVKHDVMLKIAQIVARREAKIAQLATTLQMPLQIKRKKMKTKSKKESEE